MNIRYPIYEGVYRILTLHFFSFVSGAEKEQEAKETGRR